MTMPMIIALAVTVLMIILIMVDKLPFGAPPLLALLLLVVLGVTDIKTAFGGFSNSPSLCWRLSWPSWRRCKRPASSSNSAR